MQDPNIIGVLLNAGLAGLVLVLFLRGLVVPKPTMDRTEKEVQRLIKALEAEQAAHEKTRQAWHLESTTANAAALEAARTAEHLLSDLKNRQAEITR
ncbi:hypothetical protein AB0395_41155 [Streptosporangium sp. NPDC051023]|uniref:hypothetical protein n=1 Tax=Streptosporangium sp. NPDC051023 TaxID=3155410 RepID=UPI00344D9E8F